MRTPTHLRCLLVHHEPFLLDDTLWKNLTLGADEEDWYWSRPALEERVWSIAEALVRTIKTN